MDFRPVMLVSGVLLALLGVSMLIPSAIDLASGNEDWAVFFSASMVTMMVGGALALSNRGLPKGLSTRQALLMTAVAWLVMVMFAALPFVWSGMVPNYTDAFFEAMSGLTTTGATVIIGLDTAPPGILFWRGLLQWLGGLGIIVMAVAVLPMLQIGGMQIFRAEAFETPDKILPRATQISGSMTLIFVVLTAACTLAYLMAGMPIADATIHAMTTVATGGFSTKDASIGYFNSATIDAIAIVFMILGSIPFLVYVQALQGRPGQLFKDSQIRAFAGVLVITISIGWMIAHYGGFHVGLEGLRYAAFNVVSIITGTGYASTDYGLWGQHAVGFFFAIMFIGGCAGSTSCGIKIFRFQVLAAEIRHHVNQVLYPHGVFIKRFNGRALDERTISAVMSFFFVYFASFFILAVLLRLAGEDFVTALSGAGSAISNVGPGLGDMIGPAGTYNQVSDVSKWLLAFGMLLGRLELFTVLVLLTPRFWRG
jgi:trk system potassium uptake protein TrkH